MRDNPQCFSYSVSPFVGFNAAPLFGTASAAQDEEVNKVEIVDAAPPVEAAGPVLQGEGEQADVRGGVGEDEIRRPKIGRRPVLPTKAEVDEHFPLHLQYRSWCKHCRAGKGRLAPHQVEAHDREKLGVTFSADYAFMTPEELDEEMQPSLIMYDDHKGAFWATSVRAKGVNEAVVRYVKEILDQSGYEGQKLTFKTDQEASIVALKRAVTAARTGETVPIESPVRASKSNGMMESAVGIWQGQLRTIKHYTEYMMKKRIEVDSVLFSWLVPFCSDVMNKFRVGSDGRTAYERITEHKFKGTVVGFGELVDFILETNKSETHKADSRVQQGIFLGYAWRSTECLVGTRDGIYKCRTIKRRPAETAYDPNCAEYLVTMYDDYVMKGAKTSVAAGAPRPGIPEGVAPTPTRGREFVPRRVYIKPADFEKHGHTEGCRGCEWLTNKLGPRVNHNDGCRLRMEKIIAEDETDERTRRTKERLDHYLAQQVDDGDNDKKKESADDPRPDAPGALSPQEHHVEPAADPEHFDIGSPMKDDDMRSIMEDDVEELGEAPNAPSDRRYPSPARAPPTKRKKNVHLSEPATKRSIVGDLTDDEIDQDMDSLRAKQEDMKIVSRAILGHSVEEIYSNLSWL